MAVPKKKYPSTRKKKRRVHDALTPPALSTCPQCRKPKLNHVVCKNCGTYNGRQVLKIDTSRA